MQERKEIPLVVANYALSYLPKESINDEFKMMILMYNFHGYFLCKNNYPLFDETMQAWPHGMLFNSVKEGLDYDNIDISTLPNDVEYVKKNLEYIYHKQLKFNTYQIYDTIIGKDTPWNISFGRAKDKLIVDVPNDLIKKWFVEKYINVK